MFSANSSSATRLFVVTTPQKFVLPSVHRVHVITFLMLRCVLPLPCLMFELVVRCAVLLCAVSCLPVSRVLSCLSLLSLLSLLSSISLFSIFYLLTLLSLLYLLSLLTLRALFYIFHLCPISLFSLLYSMLSLYLLCAYLLSLF